MSEAEWRALKDAIAALYARFGLMADISTVDVWRTQYKFDPKLIWSVIAQRRVAARAKSLT